ncbi:MAG: hypothetical protein QNL04_02085 [SAR324 cluster bacterium]|nr:hypothetical protein [SAR324 cluster bacterium]
MKDFNRRFYLFLALIWIFGGTPHLAYSFEFFTSAETYETKQYYRDNFLMDRHLDVYTIDSRQKTSFKLPILAYSLEGEVEQIHWSTKNEYLVPMVDYRATRKKAAWNVNSVQMDFSMVAISETQDAVLGSYERLDPDIPNEFLMGAKAYFEQGGSFFSLSKLPRFELVTLESQQFTTLPIMKSMIEIGWIAQKSEYYRFYSDSDDIVEGDEVTPYQRGSGFSYENKMPEQPRLNQFWKNFSWQLDQRLEDETRLVELEIKNKFSFFTGGIQHFITHQFFVRNYRRQFVGEDEEWVTENFTKGELSQAFAFEGVENLYDSPINLGWKFYYRHDPLMDTLQTVGANLNLKVIF